MYKKQISNSCHWYFQCLVKCQNYFISICKYFNKDFKVINVCWDVRAVMEFPETGFFFLPFGKESHKLIAFSHWIFAYPAITNFNIIAHDIIYNHTFLSMHSGGKTIFFRWTLKRKCYFWDQNDYTRIMWQDAMC